MENADQEKMTPMQFITTAQGEQLLMDGPLSQLYCQGLNELYANKNNPSAEVSMETQALTLGLLRREMQLETAPVLNQEQRANMALFYGIKRGTVRTSHMVDIMQALAALRGDLRKKSVVVIDSVVKVNRSQGYSVEEDVALEGSVHNEQSLRQACEDMGVAVYDSFQQFALHKG